MKLGTSKTIDKLMLAEAAAWLVRLQASRRSSTIEAAFKEWIAANPAHALAFARITDLWEILPGGAVALRPGEANFQRTRPRRAMRVAAVACAAALLVAGGILYLRPTEETYQTAVGDQKTVVLPDRTVLTLNTDTRLTIRYEKQVRRVRLDRGEALFQVTKNSQRPFVVEAGDAKIEDLGTVFDVHRASEKTAVTLVEGKVRISTGLPQLDQAMPAVLLNPGERLTMYTHGASVIDHQNGQEALAWQYGRVYFDDTSLADAVAEINRYGGPPIRIGDPALASLRISGTFSTHDAAQFASAVADLHHLQTAETGGAIVLKR